MGDLDACKTRLTLLEKLRDSHDDDAWSDFAYYYRGYIYNIARRMGLSHADADDVVQDVLIKSWKKLPEFRYESSKGRFRGWLCQVTGNAVKNRHRAQRSSVVEFENNPAALNAQSIRPDIERIADDEWNEYLPKLAWKNVADHFGESVHKVCEALENGLSPADVAKKLDISESSVYVYRKRIRDAMRKEMTRLERELG
ncbi:MAG: sigma-70 family RNA polymerase sigma factor [Kiritimatiellaeota bacterium]|nr:sigma-70 family RNA polymerase sigma factor [Kiritimatiellota bacterium]